ncbi:glycosyltransferase family 4 protein [Jiulongibacter sediminis]|uniref:glycosyltransferase family 4 protein n=1 Tax=Jiulongibacter sediminis TaxID=1605367 RepID=UPI0026EFECFB|nr:glycosyltransferase family 4 protein [Jiulongibacter sediminis]
MSRSKPSILFISHDANRAGAQLFLLNIMKDFQQRGFEMELLCLTKWGPLLPEFEAICPVSTVPDSNQGRMSKLFGGNPEDSIMSYIRVRYQRSDIDLIYANTIACAGLATIAKKALEVPLISHIHELQFSLDMYADTEDKQRLFELSDGVIACSQAVADNLIANNGVNQNKIEVIHSFIDNERVIEVIENSNSEQIFEEFQLPQDQFLVGACGNAEWRKGLDIFINIAQEASQKLNSVHFVWIGVKPEGDYYDQVMYDVRKMGIENQITFIPPTPKAVEIINTLDAFLVSSREDPFPLVMLEAALCEKPILGFENSGGCSEFVKDKAGLLAKYMHISGVVDNLKTFIENEQLRKEKGETGKRQILELYNFEQSSLKLKNYLEQFQTENEV